MKISKKIKRTLYFLVIITIIIFIACLSINGHVVIKEKGNIVYSKDSRTKEINQEDLTKLKEMKADSILVLGAGVYEDGTPTPMLKDRLDTGIELYKAGVADKILLTGDNGQEEYNEIHTMLTYVKNKGIPAEDIFCDHAGFSTYDSLYRAKDIFKNRKLIVVTQTYHLYRALYIGNKLGMETLGVGSDQEKYSGQYMREAREILARIKDYFKVKMKSKSLLGGEAIPINGNGIISHGE
ncbi:MAG: ElyC/SanA/YdcF family protein [Eubacteriales bacterium]|nr:ElyC/SanA/YdcF family protein [Eubacteriales bacterium]